MTSAVNIKTHKCDVFCGRGSPFGNPFKIGDCETYTREKVISEFRSYFYKKLWTDENFRGKVHELKGKVLGCYCKPKACHCDVIVEYLNVL